MMSMMSTAKVELEMLLTPTTSAATSKELVK